MIHHHADMTGNRRNSKNGGGCSHVVMRVVGDEVFRVRKRTIIDNNLFLIDVCIDRFDDEGNRR